MRAARPPASLRSFTPLTMLRRLVVLLCLVATPGISATTPESSSDLTWPEVHREMKPWTRWWWLGSAVDQRNLTRELEAIAAAGFGGVEITPIYGAKGYEDRFIPFLSPRYLEMLAHVGAEAKRLHLGVDMATGTGWPFGGPQVTPADAELKIAFDANGKIAPVPTNFKVKRSAPGGEGLVLNPYSAAAMTHYLAPFTAALATLPPGTIHSQFHDSFEYQANWATELPEKFLALHGYDLRDHAAELNGQGDPDTVARIKADYRTTLSALHLDYIRTWVDWAHAHGETARNQAHGSPGNLLDLYAAADIPETEIFGSMSFPIPGFRHEATEVGRPGHPPIIHRFASSAAHVMGKPLASSETFTWLREHFHGSPSEMKPELDQLFLAGINHVYYHGDAYSPDDAPWPGWLFYASTQFNTRNPLWRDFGDGLNAYITRAQSLLQAGTSDNDLLVYWPADDLWHNPNGLQLQLTVHAAWLEASRTGQLMMALTAKGYSYDLISDAQLGQTRVETADENSKLPALPHGATPQHSPLREQRDGERSVHQSDGRSSIKTPGGFYRAILIPPTDHMSVETLQRLLALARDGATILFVDRFPADVSGFARLAERRAQFAAELARIQLTPDENGLPTAKLGRGRIVVAPLATLLARAPVTREPLADTGLSFIRRQLDDGYVYFIANLTAQPFEGWVPLARPAKAAIELNPLRGDTGIAILRQHNGVAEVYLQQAPGESFFIKTLTTHTVAGSSARLTHPASASIMLDGEWHVTAVRGGLELPPSFTTRGYSSWTTQGGEWERFGGTARYETEFTLPGSAGVPPASVANAKADDWLLDLGDVRETARVFVNGHEIDLLWSLPLRTKIGRFLQPGKNTLALEITNLAANRIRDLDRRKVAWKNFYEINFVNIFYRPFNAADWPLQPSGLLGPVMLTPLAATIPASIP